MVEVVLPQPVPLDEVDQEIIVLAGCALGFVAAGQPPHVLHVDPDTEMEKRGIRSDDLLVSIDGRDPRNLAQSEVARALRDATRVVFERPKAAPEGEERSEAGSDNERAPVAPFDVAEADAKAAASPFDGAAATTAVKRARSRSRRRRRRGEAEAPGGDARVPKGWPPPRDAAGGPPPGVGPPGLHGPPGHPGPPPAGGRPPPHGPWSHAPPPAHWGAPPPGWHPHGHHAQHRPPPFDTRPPPPGWHAMPPPHGHPPPHPGHSSRGPPGYGRDHRDRRSPPRQRREALRLEPDASGCVSLVAERVPPSMNNMDVLNEYFGTFGSVVNLQINHSRHEAIITFSHLKEAEEALRWPVLNDHSIGLRPWKAKAGQRGPHEVPGGSDAGLGMMSDSHPAVGSSMGRRTVCDLPAAGGRKAPDGADGAAGVSAPAGGAQASTVGGNMTLTTDSSKVTAANQHKQAVQEKRMALLASLTSQLKTVMARINDPKTNDKAREQFQTILATIREKMTALTPKEEKPVAPAPAQAAPQAPKPLEESYGRQPPGRPPHLRGPAPKVHKSGPWNKMAPHGHHVHVAKQQPQDPNDSETECFDSDLEEDELEKLKLEVEAAAAEAATAETTKASEGGGEGAPAAEETAATPATGSTAEEPVKEAAAEASVAEGGEAPAAVEGKTSDTPEAAPKAGEQSDSKDAAKSDAAEAAPAEAAPAATASSDAATPPPAATADAAAPAATPEASAAPAAEKESTPAAPAAADAAPASDAAATEAKAA
eukprot:TRINITY_DN82128_c0_g1_i1.p1 TRINITY_DN82128_c0_g1~~TRINITY_DN82128_c0_g1_i1.p1  ORF type:complete len:767 (-),score=233.47 TRINITY_DN82128_c0_g1_i1:116-2416(-)